MLLSLASLNGCSKDKQLEAVAKDWCMTIRASQVIPVYPLTEDLQPGDVFLVTLPIDRQQEAYRTRGFLPLDNHLGRVQPGGYAAFYGRSVLDEQNPAVLPKAWMRPDSGLGKAWEKAPHAAFPQYTFEVRNGVGANIGVPAYGIPVGLSLLGSANANGTVTIKDARTLGVDMISLDEEARLWAAQNIGFLAPLGPPAGEPPRNFLRVVSRVYAIGSIDVFLSDVKSFGGGVDVGAPKPVDLLVPKAPEGSKADAATNSANWAEAQKNVNAALAAMGGAAPGGSLRLTGASARTVGLAEQFDPPLVIGYLGFDMAILEGGLLGPSIPSLALLEDRLPNAKEWLEKAPVGFIASRSAVMDMVKTLRSLSPQDARAAAALAEVDALDAFVPDTYQAARTAADGSISIAAQSPNRESLGYSQFARYLADMEGTINALENAAGSRPLTVDEAVVLESARRASTDPRLRVAQARAERTVAAVFVQRIFAP